MANSDIDDSYRKFMAVAPRVMELANKVVEVHLPAAMQSMQQAEELYGVLDAAIAKWVHQADKQAGKKQRIPASSKSWASWFRLRLEGSESSAKASTQ